MSVANKLSYLGETKEEIREGLNKLGGNISKSDTFRSYADAIEEIYDSMPKVEESDVESATLDGTIKGGLTIDPKGNTSQYSTTGKNLYAYGDLSYNSTYYFVQRRLLNNFEMNTTYTLSFDINTTRTPFNVSVGYGNDYYAADGFHLTDQTNGHVVFTFTPNRNDYSNLWIRVPRYGTDGVEWTATITNIQLEKGSQETSFEPYTNGASPNPDYPQPINVVSGDNTIKVEGANIFNNNIEPLLRGSYTLYSVSNNIISVSSNSSANGGLLWNIPVDMNKQITISYNSMTEILSSLNNVVTYMFADEPVTSFEFGTSINTTNKYVTITPTKKYLVLGLRTGGNTGYTLSGLQVRYSPNVEPYEPYQSQTYPINLGELELCNIEGSKDYFTKNSDGQWCKYNAIGKYTFVGTELWTENTTGDGLQLYLSASNLSTLGIPELRKTDNNTLSVMSNMFKADIFNNRGSVNNIIYSGNNDGAIRVYSTNFESYTDYKTYLTTHNLTAYFQLATPYLSLIEDETLISQLDNIQNAMSYEGQTNVLQNNNDLPFKLDLKAILDWRNNE